MQLGHRGGDRGGRQAGTTGELGAGDRAGGGQDGDDPAPGVARHGGHGAVTLPKEPTLDNPGASRNMFGTEQTT